MRFPSATKAAMAAPSPGSSARPYSAADSVRGPAGTGPITDPSAAADGPAVAIHSAGGYRYIALLNNVFKT